MIEFVDAENSRDLIGDGAPGLEGAAVSPVNDRDTLPAVAALRHNVLFGDDAFRDYEERVREAHIALNDTPEDATRRERAHRGLLLFSKLNDILGPSTETAQDPREVLAIFRWGCLAPDMAPLVSGHFALTIPSIQRLAGESVWVRRQLKRFDEPGNKGALGVFLLTEMTHGSNARDLKTEAIVDPEHGTLTLHSPTDESLKFMPNVDSDSVTEKPIIGVVAAKVKMKGAEEDEDEGIFPVLVPMDTEGIERYPLPDSLAPMGNAVTRFNKVELPQDALLLGEQAHINEDGTFICTTPKKQRFEQAVAPLMMGRVGLALSSTQSAALALKISRTYFENRLTAGNVPTMERDHIGSMVASAISKTYCAAAFGRFVGEEYIDPNTDQTKKNILAMMLKPFATYAGHEVLQELRERTGAQGMFRINRIADLLNNNQGAITAEGENQLLEISVARIVRSFGLHGDQRITLATHSDTTASRWHDMLLYRERALAQEPVDEATSNQQNIRLGKAISARLAADALQATQPPGEIAQLVGDMTDVFAIDEILKDAYFFRGELDPQTTRQMEQEHQEKKQRILDNLPALIAAFGLPESDAPIAQADYTRGWLQHLGIRE